MEAVKVAVLKSIFTFNIIWSCSFLWKKSIAAYACNCIHLVVYRSLHVPLQVKLCFPSWNFQDNWDKEGYVITIQHFRNERNLWYFKLLAMGNISIVPECKRNVYIGSATSRAMSSRTTSVLLFQDLAHGKIGGTEYVQALGRTYPTTRAADFVDTATCALLYNVSYYYRATTPSSPAHFYC